MIWKPQISGKFCYSEESEIILQGSLEPVVSMLSANWGDQTDARGFATRAIWAELMSKIFRVFLIQCR